MKKLLLLLPFFLVLSCSVQKRKYQNGYYVDWHHKKSKSELAEASKKSIHTPKTKTSDAVIEINTGNLPEQELLASKANSPNFKKHNFFKREKTDSCDQIIFKDGSEVSAKVNEVGINEIKYKRCDSPDGPFYVSRKSEIFMIKYANGTKEVIKSETSVATANETPVSSYKSNKYNRITHPLSLPALLLGSASIISAYILLIFAIDGSSANEGLLFLPFGLGLLATILGAISLGQIKSQPDIYKGKGMSIPGMIMGIVMASIMLLIIFAVFLW